MNSKIFLSFTYFKLFALLNVQNIEIDIKDVNILQKILKETYDLFNHGAQEVIDDTQGQRIREKPASSCHQLIIEGSSINYLFDASQQQNFWHIELVGKH